MNQPDGLCKFTPETAAIILDWLRRGHYRKTACAKVRITERTLQNWVARGEAGIAPYAEFVLDMYEAEAVFEDRMLTEITSAQSGTPGVSGGDVWTSRAWVMERRWPKRWSARVRVSVSEEIDMFTAKFKDSPELYARVMDALRGESPQAAPTGSGAH